MLLLLHVFALVAPPQALPTDLPGCLDEALQANMSHELRRQRKVLLHAETLEGRAEDRAEVQRELALLDWKFEREDDAARERLRKAAGGPEPGEAWIALVRLEVARERWDAACAAAAAALEATEKTELRYRARLALAGAAVGAAGAARRSGDAPDEERLAAAHRLARELVREEPGALSASQVLVHTSILVEDGASALTGLRSYYHMVDGRAAPNAVADAAGRLHGLLPRLGTQGLSDEERIELVVALRQTHFHEPAALLALAPETPDDPRVSEAVAYADFAHDLRQDVAEYYRERALGKRNRSALDKLVRKRIAALHKSLDEPGRLPKTTEKRWEWLADRFGVYGSIGYTANYYDLHMGHAVIDETRNVTQYDQSADLRFVALDHMISNGFQSWAWTFGAQHGGWATEDAFWQVRSAYAGDTVEIWRLMQDEESRAKAYEEIERESALDDERAREDRFAYLPGLMLRMRVAVAFSVLEKYEAQGLSGSELRVAFIRDLEAAIFESSIFAHEGRHAIDKRIGDFDSATLEYRAKLSQMAFAPYPRLALSGIIAPNTREWDTTPHAKANRRAIDGLLDWMEDHADEIDGLDETRPLLPQVDRMSDEQLREAFRSMDPLAKAMERSR